MRKKSLRTSAVDYIARGLALRQSTTAGPAGPQGAPGVAGVAGPVGPSASSTVNDIAPSIYSYTRSGPEGVVGWDIFGDQGVSLPVTDDWIAPRGGWITEVHYMGVGAGNMNIDLRTPTGTHTSDRTATITIPSGSFVSSGVPSTYVLPIPVRIEKGQWVVPRNDAGRIATRSTSTNGQVFGASPPDVGAVSTDIARFSALSLVIMYQNTVGEATRKQGYTSVIHEMFSGTAIPSWAAAIGSGTITYPAGGCRIVGTDYMSGIKHTKKSFSGMKTISSVFTLNSGTPKPFIGAIHTSFPTLLGSLCILDLSAGLSAGVLRGYPASDFRTGFAPNPDIGAYYQPIVSTTIPFTFVLGDVDRYRISVTSDMGRLAFTVEDRKVLANKFTLYAHDGDAKQMGPLMGAAYFGNAAGDVTFSQFDFGINCSTDAMLAIAGDSIHMGDYYMGGVNDYTGANLILSYLRDHGMEAVNLSVAGAKAIDLVGAADIDVDLFNYKNVLITIGANEGGNGDLSSWKTNLAALIARYVARGTRVWLATLTPYPTKVYPSGPSTGLMINLDQNIAIRTKFFGDYGYVEIANPMSVAGDGANWFTDDSWDGLHPRFQKGHARWFSIVKNALPFLNRL